MKTIKILILLLFFISGSVFSQRGRGHGQGRGRGYGHRSNIVVIKRSPYRPAKIVVFHPAWRPMYAYNRRWVFFPNYNIYWDNWRNHYVFWNGMIWISQPAPPPVIVNVNLEKEKNYELKENEDDVDDVYKSNEAHKKEYKTE